MENRPGDERSRPSSGTPWVPGTTVHACARHDGPAPDADGAPDAREPHTAPHGDADAPGPTTGTPGPDGRLHAPAPGEAPVPHGWPHAPDTPSAHTPDGRPHAAEAADAHGPDTAGVPSGGAGTGVPPYTGGPDAPLPGTAPRTPDPHGRSHAPEAQGTHAGEGGPYTAAPGGAHTTHGWPHTAGPAGIRPYGGAPAAPGWPQALAPDAPPYAVAAGPWVPGAAATPYPGAQYGAPGYGGWPPPQHWAPPPPPRRRGRGVLAASAVAATVALAALAASVVIVATTPPPQPVPTGENLSSHYDDRLAEPPAEVVVDIADHPLYDTATPRDIACDVPELDMGSDDSWEEFATATGDCLDELWAPVFEDLGLSAATPEITVTRESPDSGDEEGYTLAYYESDFERITVVLPNVRTLGGQIPARAREDVWVALMGHEYGHHVQYVTGILDISHELRRTSKTDEEELDTLRRTELQAECMAGIGLRAIAGDDEQALQWVNENFNGGGDLPTHGTATNRAHWLEEGWSETTVGGCNTYGASPGEVT